MKLLKYVILFFLLQIVLPAQSYFEKELERSKEYPNLKLNIIDHNRISVKYGNIKERIFYYGKSINQNSRLDSIPKFVFNLFQMDTTLFYYKFKFQQEVPIGETWRPPLLGDINNNGREEYYGIKKGFFTNYSDVFCYEQNQNGLFIENFKYPDSTFQPFTINDVDRDGQQELHLVARHFDSLSEYPIWEQTFFKKNRTDSLATEFYFNYNISSHDGLNGQLNDFTFGDFDKDSINEAIYFGFSPQTVHLVKFNKNTLTFDSLLTYPTVENEFIEGFTVGDFDMDGKTDIVYASGLGRIYVVENNGINKYSIVWQGDNGIFNSYINFKTNDINGNGKPEFWIGGQDFDNSLTRLIGYETDGDNSYHPIAELEFPGVCSFNGLSGTAIDVDNDGIDELFFRNGNVIAIIKFTGTAKNPDFRIYYFYILRLNYIDTANIIVFPNEKYPTIILSMEESSNWKFRIFSWVFKHFLITDISKENPNLVKNYELYNNYPNPFNPATTIRFSIPERTAVKIRVFNSLGEEIITLTNTTLERGEHSINWNGTDKNNKSVPSGVYFITMEANNFRKTVKSVLLK